MPDVMTPESMVTKLDEFESMAEDAVSQEDRDVSTVQYSPHTQQTNATHASVSVCYKSSCTIVVVVAVIVAGRCGQ